MHDSNFDVDEAGFSYTLNDLLTYGRGPSEMWMNRAAACLMNGISRSITGSASVPLDCMTFRFGRAKLIELMKAGKDVEPDLLVQEYAFRYATSAILHCYSLMCEDFARKRQDLPSATLAQFAAAAFPDWSKAGEADLKGIATRRHSLVYTDDLAGFTIELENAGWQVHDLSLGTDFQRIQRNTGIPSEFVSGFRYSAFKTALGYSAGHPIDAASAETWHKTPRAPKSGRPHLAILSLHDAIMLGGLDLILAQSRALGYHVMVHWDIEIANPQDKLSAVTVKMARENTSTTLFHAKDRPILVTRADKQDDYWFPKKPNANPLQRLFGAKAG